MKIAATLVFLLLLSSPAWAHDWSHKDFAQANALERKWLQKQRHPKTNVLCCNDADGEQVEEDIRNGRYWINSNHTRGIWMLVPDEVVIREPNMHGRPVAWFRWEGAGSIQTLPRDDLRPVIYCYVPGAGL